MNKIKRIKMLKAMEYIIRQINDEEVFEFWLMDGIADGDVKIGDLSIKDDDEENLDYYLQDKVFSEIMGTFLHVVSKAKKSGGLYCDDICSNE